MFNLYDSVLIKTKNIPGTIVDILTSGNETVYTVESDKKGKSDDGFGGIWPLFDCKESDLQIINRS